MEKFKEKKWQNLKIKGKKMAKFKEKKWAKLKKRQKWANKKKKGEKHKMWPPPTPKEENKNEGPKTAKTGWFRKKCKKWKVSRKVTKTH